LLHDLSNHQAAAPIYDAILANYPNTEQAAWAHLWKVQIGYINGESTPAEAVPIYQLIVQSSKYLHVRASAQYMIGYSYYRQGKNAQAIKAFEKVRTDYPASYSDLQAQTLRFIARLERIQGNFDQSKQILREALQKYPTSRWAESIQSALDEFAEMEAATAYGLEHLNDVVLEEETE
jgi:TolA-binding protein